MLPTTFLPAANGPARLATTTSLAAYTYNNGSSGVGATITLTATGVLTIDGSIVDLNDRVLVANETDLNLPHNGIYKCTTPGVVGVAAVLTRATDADTPTQLNSVFVFISAGAANANATFVQTDVVVTVGTSNIQWLNTSAGLEFRTSQYRASSYPLHDCDLAAHSAGGVLVIDTDETLQGDLSLQSMSVHFAGGSVTLDNYNLTV